MSEFTVNPNMRRILTAAGAIGAVFAMAACGPRDTVDAASSAPTSTAVEQPSPIWTEPAGEKLTVDKLAYADGTILVTTSYPGGDSFDSRLSCNKAGNIVQVPHVEPGSLVKSQEDSPIKTGTRKGCETNSTLDASDKLMQVGQRITVGYTNAGLDVLVLSQ